MTVFISWSGEKSKAVGAALNRWIPLVLQSVKTWYSPEDIAAGARWFGEIEQSLEGSNAGIVCLTAENKESPWILFESGALAIGVGKKSLFTFLTDLNPQDVKPPLGQFNHTWPTRESIFKLMGDLNKIAPTKLAPEALKNIFDAMWPRLEEELQAAQKIQIAALPEREIKDMVAELLELARQHANQLDQIGSSVALNSISAPSALYSGLGGSAFPSVSGPTLSLTDPNVLFPTLSAESLTQALADLNSKLDLTVPEKIGESIAKDMEAMSKALEEIRITLGPKLGTELHQTSIGNSDPTP